MASRSHVPGLAAAAKTRAHMACQNAKTRLFLVVYLEPKTSSGWWFFTHSKHRFIYPIGSIYGIYGNISFTINIAPMLAYIPYMDPMGMVEQKQ